MHEDNDTIDRGDAFPHQRAVAMITVAAGVISLAGLVVGLAGADFDFEAVNEVETYIALGADAVELVRWGLWLTLFGSYLLLAPIAMHLLAWLRRDDPVVADLSTVAAGFYILLGAAGAAVLAASHPDLIAQYAGADAATQADLVTQFDLVRRIGEDGLQGLPQNVAGAAWFLGIGSLLRRHWRGPGIFTMVIGALLLLNVVGTLVDVEVLRLLGLTGQVLLVPVWAVWMGMSLLRAR